MDLISPYGNGPLLNLLVIDEDERRELIARAYHLEALQLSARSLCDLELLAVGAFTPLDRFMGVADYQRVLTDMRLASGVLFPIPVTLSAPQEFAGKVGQDIALRSQRNDLLAIMTITEHFNWDWELEARLVYGTTDIRHPLVADMATWGPVCLSGPIRVLAIPRHYSFRDLRLTPAEVRLRLQKAARRNVIAFQTRNPIHRVHEEMTKRATAQVDGTLLLHPVVGLTKPGDIDFYTRVRTYKVLLQHHYDPDRTILSLLPLAMRMAGPREAVWHALIRRNYGASHFIVGRDHAGPGLDSHGQPFYDPLAAQTLVTDHATELGITPLFFNEMVYLPDQDRYEELQHIANRRSVSLSGTQVRDDYLVNGRQLPEWFTRPVVAAILTENTRPRHQQGFCVWLTGLSGAGKSAIADILVQKLLELGRPTTLLDGDVVRTHLSKGLGFSREDRNTNILRIGFVASEIVRHHGAVICAAISPYRVSRNQVREWVGDSQFLLIYVNTALAVCAQRDTKGIYARAQRGEIHGVTGIDDPYEPPEAPDLTVDGGVGDAETHAERIIHLLAERGFVKFDRSTA